MTDKPMSRQRRWRKKMIAEGRCMICGKPRTSAAYCDLHLRYQRNWRDRRRNQNLCIRCGAPRDCDSKSRCFKCLKKYRLAQRRKSGYRPWREGYPGRPPIERNP